MVKLMKHLMSQNEKLMAAMLKQTLGGNGIGGISREINGGRISKVPSRREWKVGDKHPYNGKTLKIQALS